MINYEPFFAMMKAQGVSTYALFKKGFSERTYYRMKHGQGITTDTIASLCKLFDCRVEDIIEYVPTGQDEK